MWNKLIIKFLTLIGAIDGPRMIRYDLPKHISIDPDHPHMMFSFDEKIFYAIMDRIIKFVDKYINTGEAELIGIEHNILTELQEIYDWYILQYPKVIKGINRLYNKLDLPDINVIMNRAVIEYKTVQDEKTQEEIIEDIVILETKLAEEKNSMLIRYINIKDYIF